MYSHPTLNKLPRNSVKTECGSFGSEKQVSWTERLTLVHDLQAHMFSMISNDGFVNFFFF